MENWIGNYYTYNPASKKGFFEFWKFFWEGNLVVV